MKLPNLTKNIISDIFNKLSQARILPGLSTSGAQEVEPKPESNWEESVQVDLLEMLAYFFPYSDFLFK